MSKIEKLRDGFRSFRDGQGPEQRKAFLELVTMGQSPSTLFVGCCDSRVDPAIITSSKPGDLFVVRNIANLVPPYDGDDQVDEMAAALEFSVENLKIRDIIVMGHSRCAGIQALYDAVKDNQWPESALHNWLRIGEKAARLTLESEASCPEEEQLQLCGRRSVIDSIERLKTYPLVQRRMAAKALFLHGWYFHMEEMQVEAYDQASGEFHVIA